MLKIAWLTDWHGIFVDRDAWELALRLVQDYKPDVVPVGSDDIDFYRLSKFSKNPARRKTLQNELDRQFELNKELKDAVDPFWNSTEKPLNYKPVEHPTVLGNHNERFIKRLWEDDTFYGVTKLSYPYLLDYQKFGYTWNGDVWDFAQNREYSVGPITFVHGTKVSQFPGYSVKNEMAGRLFDSSLVMGHCHRGAVTHIRRADGTLLTGIEGFCLCQLETEYASNTNWSQGVVFITLHEDIPQFELIPFQRIQGSLHAYWRDKTYSVALTSGAYT